MAPTLETLLTEIDWAVAQDWPSDSLARLRAIAEAGTRLGAEEALLVEINYAMEHGWPAESLSRLQSMAAAARARAARKPMEAKKTPRRKLFEFEDFQDLCAQDISRFRDSFYVMLDTNGVIPSYTVGFHFSFSDENPAEEAEFLELAQLFKPTCLWAGSQEVQQKLTELDYTSTLFSFFEDGGYMVVLKVPVVGWDAPLEA